MCALVFEPVGVHLHFPEVDTLMLFLIHTPFPETGFSLDGNSDFG